MKNFWTILSVILVVVILLLSSVLYQVRETETVIVKRFGEVVRTVDEPGLHVKLPYPIEIKIPYDSRRRLLEGVEEQTATASSETIKVKSYAIWAIDKPEKFLTSVKDEENAERTLNSLIRDAQNSVIGKHYFSEFVNTDPSKIQFEQIEKEIADAVKDKASEKYGIKIVAVGIQQLDVHQDTTSAVFERMRAERNGRKDLIIKEGDSEATRIRGDAESKRKELLAVAEAQAQLIRGAGDAEAAKYYEMLKEDPELAMFLRNLAALKKILAEKTTIVLGVETEPIYLLKGIPDIETENNASKAEK